ncbi:MAG: DinB family protein [Acidobacteriota bacterium]
MKNDELLIATAVAGWKMVIGRLDGGIKDLDDAGMERHVAPGRNRVRYVVGHLVAVNDRLFEGLGLGARLHPELDDAYIRNADGVVADPVSTEELKAAWTEVHAALTAAVEKLTPAEWAERHTLVSEEDFAKEPLRNRLAMFLSRTNHTAFHGGQLVLAKEKS